MLIARILTRSGYQADLYTPSGIRISIALSQNTTGEKCFDLRNSRRLPKARIQNLSMKAIFCREEVDIKSKNLQKAAVALFGSVNRDNVISVARTSIVRGPE